MKITSLLVFAAALHSAPLLAASYDIDPTRSYIEVEQIGDWQNVGVYGPDSPQPDMILFTPSVGEPVQMYRWELAKTTSRIEVSGRIGIDLVESDYTPGVFRAYLPSHSLTSSMTIPGDLALPYYLNYTGATGAVSSPPELVDNDGFFPYVSCLCMDMGPSPESPRTYYSGTLSPGSLDLTGLRNYGSTFFFESYDYIVSVDAPTPSSRAGTSRINRIVLAASITAVPEVQMPTMWAAGLMVMGVLARRRMHTSGR